MKEYEVEIELRDGNLNSWLLGPPGSPTSVASLGSVPRSFDFHDHESRREQRHDMWERWRLISRVYQAAEVLGVEVKLVTDGSSLVHDMRPELVS